MFSFFRSAAATLASNKSETKTSSVFSDDDVRSVFQSLSLENDSQDGWSKGAPDLLPSRSRDGLLKVSELSKAIKQRLLEERGKILVVALAESLDARESDVNKLVKANKILTTAEGKQLISITETRRIAFVLEHSANTRFVSLDGFIAAQGLDMDTLMTMLKYKLEDGRSLRLEYQTFGKAYDRRFCVSPALAAQVKAMITRDVQRASKVQEETVWQEKDFLGLPMDCARIFVNSILTSESITGSLSADEKNLQFTPHSYLEKSKYRQSDDVLSGKLPSIPLADFPKNLLVEGKSAAAATSESRDWIITNSPFLSISEHVISSQYLGEQLSNATRSVGEDQVYNLQNTVESLPPATQEQALARVIEAARSRSDGANFSIYDQYIISSQWLDQKRQQMQEESSKVANSMWEDDSYQKVKSNVLKSKLRDQIFKAWAIETSVSDAIWRDSNSSLSKEALEVYSTRISVLERENEDQFRQFWGSRVNDKAQLHAAALHSLSGAESPSSSLHTQLDEVLRKYLATELVPQAVARAKTKGLTKSSQLKLPKRFTSLEAALHQAKDVDAAMQAFTDFNVSTEIAKAADSKTVKQAMIADMIKTTKKDSDGPRLFLTAVIVTVASKHEGVIYATGKFAPKLLKHIKPQLELELSTRLEQLKEVVKSNKVTDDDREELRSIAAKAAAPC